MSLIPLTTMSLWVKYLLHVHLCRLISQIVWHLFCETRRRQRPNSSRHKSTLKTVIRQMSDDPSKKKKAQIRQCQIPLRWPTDGDIAQVHTLSLTQNTQYNYTECDPTGEKRATEDELQAEKSPNCYWVEKQPTPKVKRILELTTRRRVVRSKNLFGKNSVRLRWA